MATAPYVIIDTETTGLSYRRGDRLCEIGAVLVDEHFNILKSFHAYVNPERSVPYSAQRVHGLSTQFLADKPRFADIAPELLAFVKGRTLIAHNATFDMGFLNHELAQTQHPTFEDVGCDVFCTLRWARRHVETPSHSLNALCSHFSVDTSSRVKHGALLDAEILTALCREMFPNGLGR